MISERTSIPVTRLVEDESKRLLNLEKRLHKRVIGQEHAVEILSDAVRRARVGSGSKKPIEVLSLGPTGVGKRN